MSLNTPLNTSLNTNPSQGVTLLLNFFFGVLGVDKFYVGRYDLGIIQLILTLTFFGMIFTVPWALICGISLIIAILYGGLPFMYPGIKFAPLTSTDKTIAWIVLGVMIIGSLISPLIKKKKNTNESYICPVCGMDPCQCRRGGCRSCSRGMISPYEVAMM